MPNQLPFLVRKLINFLDLGAKGVKNTENNGRIRFFDQKNLNIHVKIVEIRSEMAEWAFVMSS